MRAMPTPSTNERPRFHSDMPVSEFTERDTQAPMRSRGAVKGRLVFVIIAPSMVSVAEGLS